MKTSPRRTVSSAAARCTSSSTPSNSADEYLTYAQEIDAAYSGGPSVALSTLINPWEFSGMETGAKLFIRENGTTEGTLGDSALDADAVKNALDLMADGQEQAREDP